ncbi:helix-turn-helix transcriptional regulator [Wenzhouxiangella sp. XN79A]|nr:helix-turn-helix transcriptional regulator [Wenzhouxiangella sp. XN79A]
MFTMKQIGEAVRARRKALGLTQIEAAGLCGVGERFLRELELGKPTVQMGKALQVLSGLGLKLSIEAGGR